MPGLMRLIAVALARWSTVGYYLATRATNGIVALVQAYVVVAVLGEAEAGRYFLFWTAAWLLSVVMRLGVDGVMPRVVAESAAGSVPVPSLRPAARWSLALGVAAAPAALLALGLEHGVMASAACLLVSTAWALIHVVGAVLRASRHVVWSGVVTNVVWPVGAAAAPLGLLVADRTWMSLAWLTVASALVAVAVSAAVAARVAGVGPLLRQLAARRSTARMLDRDTLGAAVVGTLAETLVWLPVLLAAALGTPADVAVVFVAARLAGPFSWGYQAVVAVLSPQLAADLAERRLDRVGSLLRRGATGGLIVSLPVCIAGLALAGPLVEAMLGRPSADGAAVLRLLIAARAVDALSGPVGESLLIGRRAWLDAGRFVIALAAGAAVAAVLDASASAVVAAGAGAAATFVLANVLGLVLVRRLLAHGWALERRALLRGPEPSLALVALGAACSAVAWSELDARARVAAAVAGALLLGAGCVWWGARRIGLRALLLSPAGVAVALLATHFVLRPAALAAHPSIAALGVRVLGYSWSDVAQATSIGSLGLAALVLAYAWAAGRAPAAAREAAGPPVSPAVRRLVAGALATLAFGTLLWGTLFLRLGGPAVLVSDPAALKTSQFGGSYGTFGLLLCLATTLVVLWAWLQRPSRLLAWTLAAAAATSVAASLALATRSSLAVTVVAAVLVVARHRRPRRRTVAALAALAALLFVVNGLARQVRENAQNRPMAEAISTTLSADPLATLSGDLIEFDHLVALVELVPERLPALDGRSLFDIPRAFLPRVLYGAKPLPVDYELSRQLYGPETTAGTPTTLPGELFWNAGLAGTLAGMAAAGLLLAAARRRLVAAGPLGVLAWCLVTGYCYLLFTRPVAFMLLLLAMALLSLWAAAVATGFTDARLPLARLGRRAQRLVPAADSPR